jgi:hypothetical protein
MPRKENSNWQAERMDMARQEYETARDLLMVAERAAVHFAHENDFPEVLRYAQARHREAQCIYVHTLLELGYFWRPS